MDVCFKSDVKNTNSEANKVRSRRLNKAKTARLNPEASRHLFEQCSDLAAGFLVMPAHGFLDPISIS
jgi:hypothetical protein